MTHAGEKSSARKHRSPSAMPPDPSTSPSFHIPVLLDEAIALLAPVDGGIYVDCTLGLGGHAERILQTSSPSGRVIGFEWDAHALELASTKLEPFGDRFTAQHRNYTEIMKGLHETGNQKVDGVLLDLGVSSLQFDKKARGFSFQAGGPLDMRMDRRHHQTAEDIINSYNRDDLADIFYYYGEERQARRIAAHIVHSRNRERIATTTQLAQIVAAAVPRKFHPRKIHAATKVFQALRIAVNKELDNLTAILDMITEVLKPGGRICIITFHSLEDRLVKWKFIDNPLLHVLTKKPVTPGDEEIRTNPRSRSAKLRAAYHTG